MADRSLSAPASRRGATHAVGLIFAVGILIIFAVIVLIFVLRTSPKAADAQIVSTNPGPAPDIKTLPSAAQTGGVSSLSGGERFFAQIVAKDDVNRLAGEITATRYEPVEGQRFKLEKPDGWVFLKSGRTIHVEGDRGRTYMPDQSAGASPRNGVLEGNVVIKMFEAKPGGKRPNLAVDVPILVFTTSIVEFDGELGQVKAPEKWLLVSGPVDYSGSDLTILFNDIQQRIELLHIARTAYAIFHPGYKSQAQPVTSQMATATPTASGAPAAPAPTTQIPAPAVAAASPQRPKPADAPPLETLYHVVCKDNVVVTQSGRQITSDTLDGWVRMIGHSLRPGAIASSNLLTSAKPAASTSAGAASPTQPPTASAPSDATTPAPAPLAAAADNTDPVKLTFDGPLDLRPLTDNPIELTYNDVFVRFISAADGRTTFADTKTKSAGSGSLLEYGATRRDVALGSIEPMAAEITLPGSGTAHSQRFEMSLLSGTAHVPGRGIIEAEDNGTTLPIMSDGKLAEPSQGPRSLAWTDQADFTFRKSANGEVTPSLARISANGAATATDGTGSLSGNSLIATFVRVSDKTSRLERLEVAGNSTGEDGHGARLKSDTLDIAFVPAADNPEQSDPSVVTAQGGVQAQRSDSYLTSGYLKATLGRSPENQLVVTHVAAHDRVYFENIDGVHAKADELDADPIAKTVRLTGPPQTVQVSKDQTTITGQDITMLDAERRLDASGTGTLSHQGPLTDKPADDASARNATAEASWSTHMTFNDATGHADCLGDVTAILTQLPNAQNGTERDTIRGEELHLTFTPAPPTPPGAIRQGGSPAVPNPGDPAQPQQPPRRLLTVQAIGTLATDPTGKPATVESRRYALNQPTDALEPVLERLFYLESARINANNEDGTLKTPDPGKLFVMDSRAAEAKPDAKPAADNPAILDTNSRGTSLFTWAGDMSMDRPSGNLHMNDHVRLVHQPTGVPDNQAIRTVLECEDLRAVIRELNAPARTAMPTPNTDSFSGQLVSADATGAVWLQSGPRELVADTVHYDAIKRFVNAKAAPNNLASIFDPKTSAPISAAELDWDLDKDRVDIKKPSIIVAPR